MSIRIVCDSCTDLSDQLKQDEHIRVVPLMLHVDGRDFIDDETFNQKDFLAANVQSLLAHHQIVICNILEKPMISMW